MGLPIFTQSECDGEKGANGFKQAKKSCLLVTLSSRRLRLVIVIQTFMPTGLIVVISWMSLWLHADAVPGRVTLGITTLLTITTFKNSALHGLPQVSYIRAIDVWMGACTAFVFGALLEFILANYMHRKEMKRLNDASALYTTTGAFGLRTLCATLDGNSSVTRCIQWPFSADPVLTPKPQLVPMLTANRIDHISRLLFPIAFLLFNVLFWFNYCRDAFMATVKEDLYATEK